MLLISVFFEESDPPPKEYSPPDIDEGLFKKIGQGDANALEQLYYLTERSLYAYALSLSKNHDEALELMQETYLKILSAAHLYQSMGKPLAWIFTIARNLFYSQKEETHSGKSGILQISQQTSGFLMLPTLMTAWCSKRS
jgi:DNA-directed RNA polymerase specialized sigma subunit, sigma24 homolog